MFSYFVCTDTVLTYFFFLAEHSLSLVLASRCFSLVGVHWLYFDRFSQCRTWAPGHVGFSSQGSQALAECSVVVGHVLVPPQHVGSFQTRDSTYVPCTGRWILSHWTTGEVPFHAFLCMERGKSLGLLKPSI